MQFGNILGYPTVYQFMKKDYFGEFWTWEKTTVHKRKKKIVLTPRILNVLNFKMQ